jgi:hypothetical protein
VSRGFAQEERLPGMTTPMNIDHASSALRRADTRPSTLPSNKSKNYNLGNPLEISLRWREISGRKYKKKKKKLIPKPVVGKDFFRPDQVFVSTP